MALLPFAEEGRLEAGCDEAGRGCIAGPVVAAAVILGPHQQLEALNDSKQLSASVRESLYEWIIENALAHAIAFVDPRTIEKINILQSSFLAMHQAVAQLKTTPEFLLIDGNRFKSYPEIPHACVIKGDGKYQSIAAASILAKVARDRYMERLHHEFPDYQWNRNKGYPTAAHRAAIEKIGPSEHHRMSFQLLPRQLKLPLDSSM